MIDPRLQLLIAVSEYGTVTGAGEALQRSPSGVSKQLKELAADLDITLLERQGRGVRLTPAGQRLVEHARVMNAQWERALAETALAATELCGRIDIGAFPTALAAIVAPAVVSLRRDHPGLQPRVHELYSGTPLRELETGAIDVGLLVGAAGRTAAGTRPRQVSVTELATDPIDLLVHRGHRLAGPDPVDLADAADEDWITGRPGQDAFLELVPAARAAGFVPRVAHHAQEFAATSALVAAGLGVAAVPRLATVMPHPDVVRVTLAGPRVPARTILVAVRAGSEDNPRIAVCVTALRAAAAEALSAGAASRRSTG